MSIREQVQLGTTDESWAIHTNGSLWVEGIGCGPPIDGFERGDPQGVPLLPIHCASRWHEDVSCPSSPVLLERDEEACREFCLTVSHMPASQG